MPKRPASVITLEVDRNQRADGVPGKRVFQTAVMQLQMIPDRLSPCPGYLRARPNLAAKDTDQLAEYIIDDLTYLQENPHLLASFLNKTGPFPKRGDVNRVFG